MGEPTGVKVCVPVVDGVLGVTHTEDVEVFLDGVGSNRCIGKDCNIHVVCKGSVEVTNVS